MTYQQGYANVYIMKKRQAPMPPQYIEATNVWDETEYQLNPAWEAWNAGRSSRKDTHHGSSLRRRVGAMVVGVLVAGGAIGGAMALGHGGGASAEKAPTRPAATAKAHPRPSNTTPNQPTKPLVEGGLINLANALQNKVPIPEAVKADAASVVTVLGYVGVHGNPNKGYSSSTGYDGTGYKVPGGKIMTAGHVVKGDGSPNTETNLNFTEVATNVGGKLHRDAITAYQVSSNFSATNNYGESTNVDAAELTVGSKTYIDGSNIERIGASNGFESIPAIPFAQEMPKPGSIVFVEGMRNPDAAAGSESIPPTAPVIEEGVVAGYSGNQAIVVPLDQSVGFYAMAGDSGSPALISSGEAFGTFDGVGQMVVSEFNGPNGFGGLKVTGGTPINPNNPNPTDNTSIVEYWEVSTNNPANLGVLNDTPPAQVHDPLFNNQP